jgi:ferritin-like metal-binding protein YciE
MTQTDTTITTLHNLLDYEASKFSSAEIQLKHELPGWINKANSIMLKNVLQKYHEYIQQHLEKLEAVIEEEQIISLALTNHVMQAYIEETKEKLAMCTDAEVADACLLASVQSINHFKISSYGTAAAFANMLEMGKTAAFFHEAEVSEKQIDDRLTQLAQFEINSKARSPIILPG